MIKVAYSNIYIVFMGIKRMYEYSISSQYVNNCIDGFVATQIKLTSNLRGRLYMSSNKINAPHVSLLYYMFESPLYEKWNQNNFVLCWFEEMCTFIT